MQPQNAEEHQILTKDCKTYAITIKCANCAEEHTANNVQCPEYIRNIEEREKIFRSVKENEKPLNPAQGCQDGHFDPETQGLAFIFRLLGLQQGSPGLRVNSNFIEIATLNIGKMI